jgi:hypothetical protein
MVENNQSCDPDDVVCQMEVLRHLKGLEQQMGNQAFLEKYPQLANTKEQIASDVVKQQQKVDAAIDRCGREEGAEVVVEPVAEEQVQRED